MTNKLQIVNETQDKPWFQKGLKFKCTECGKCCGGGCPGYVWVTKEEIETICKFLNVSINDFRAKYIRVVKNKLSLIEKHNYDCIFLKDNQCSIYSVRPTQCKTYPWWPQNLSSQEAWQELVKDCEGVNHPEADRVPYENIQNHLSQQINHSNKRSL